MIRHETLDSDPDGAELGLTRVGGGRASREYGAKGSKLTGSGGGGCIIAYTPENSDEIYKQLRKDYATFKCVQSDTGVSAEIIN